MAETKRQPRESISTRIDPDAHAVIERNAEERRTTAAQVARILLEGPAAGHCPPFHGSEPPSRNESVPPHGATADVPQVSSLSSMSPPMISDTSVSSSSSCSMIGPSASSSMASSASTSSAASACLP